MRGGDLGGGGDGVRQCHQARSPSPADAALARWRGLSLATGGRCLVTRLPGCGCRRYSGLRMR
ncbi:TilS substrate-binding domain-containing protein [Aquisalimonas asiatica]|uniref:TilS substrate-binding domain-containing protein n=1 Tax=Aquisalimonas asiatica TaxID=406100 RepID=UPI003CCC0EE6